VFEAAPQGVNAAKLVAVIARRPVILLAIGTAERDNLAGGLPAADRRQCDRVVEDERIGL
jgi:hypothetical protein